MKISYLIISLILLGALSSCGILRKAPTLPPEDIDPYTNYFPSDSFSFSAIKIDLTDTIPIVVVNVSMEKRACFGKCPVYSASFYSNGRVVYEGKAYVEMLGMYESFITKKQLNDIISQAERIDYFRLASYYPTYGQTIDELPATLTSVELSYKENSVENIHHSPVKLQRFERMLEELLLELNWSKIND